MSDNCDIPEHGPTCEGNALHIRARCPRGCPQFQDGSWMAREFCVAVGTPHPPLPGRKRPAYGEAQAMSDWLKASFAMNRALCVVCEATSEPAVDRDDPTPAEGLR